MKKRECEMHVDEMKPNSTRRYFIQKIETIRALAGEPGLGGRWSGSLESLYDLLERERGRA